MRSDSDWVISNSHETPVTRNWVDPIRQDANPALFHLCDLNLPFFPSTSRHRALNPLVAKMVFSNPCSPSRNLILFCSLTWRSLLRTFYLLLMWICLVSVLLQLFFSYFKELVGKEVTVELKNDLAIRGILHSVDQYLNIKLENIRVVDQDKYPHMVLPPPSLSSCFPFPNFVHYMHMHL